MQKAQVTFCGQGEANSGTTAAPSKKHRDDFFLTASVPPSTTRKSQANGSFQVCCTLKWRKKVKIPELSLSILGCWKQPSICAGHTSAGRQGAACLSLAKACDPGAQILPAAWDCIWKENTFMDFAGRLLPEHTWRAKVRHGQLRPRSPADHPPPPGPRSQRALVLPPVSSGHPSAARDQELFES